MKNTLFQWILQNILENQAFQRIAKFIMVDFYEMDFMIGIVILVKVDEMYNSLLATVYWWKDENGIGWSKFFLESVLERLLRPSFIKGCRFHYVKDTAAEKELDITMSTTPEHVSSEIQENGNGRKK